jgi:hypothetical protein
MARIIEMQDIEVDLSDAFRNLSEAAVTRGLAHYSDAVRSRGNRTS